MGKTIGAGVGAAVAGPLGAAVGAAIGHWIDQGYDIPQDELCRVQYFSILVAAAKTCAPAGQQLSTKQMQHLQHVGSLLFNTQDLNEIQHAIRVAMDNTPPAQECGQSFSLFSEDAAVGLMCQVVSVLYTHPESLDQAVHWIGEVIATSGIPQEHWDSCFCFFAALPVDQRRREHLKTLGLEPGASEEQIKSQYRTLSRDYHPDANPNAGGALRRLGEERMAQINVAYEQLLHTKDPQLFVRSADGAWRSTTGLPDPFVTSCVVCEQKNRVRRATVTRARCGLCHARAAHPDELVRWLHPLAH